MILNKKAYFIFEPIIAIGLLIVLLSAMTFILANKHAAINEPYTQAPLAIINTIEQAENTLYYIEKAATYALCDAQTRTDNNMSTYIETHYRNRTSILPTAHDIFTTHHNTALTSILAHYPPATLTQTYTYLFKNNTLKGIPDKDITTTTLEPAPIKYTYTPTFTITTNYTIELYNTLAKNINERYTTCSALPSTITTTSLRKDCMLDTNAYNTPQVTWRMTTDRTTPDGYIYTITHTKPHSLCAADSNLTIHVKLPYIPPQQPTFTPLEPFDERLVPT